MSARTRPAIIPRPVRYHSRAGPEAAVPRLFTPLQPPGVCTRLADSPFCVLSPLPLSPGKGAGGFGSTPPPSLRERVGVRVGAIWKFPLTQLRLWLAGSPSLRILLPLTGARDLVPRRPHRRDTPMAAQSGPDLSYLPGVLYVIRVPLFSPNSPYVGGDSLGGCFGENLTVCARPRGGSPTIDRARPARGR